MKIKYLISALFLSTSCHLAYADCGDDYVRINNQIYVDGSIQTIDGQTINYIDNLGEHDDGTCVASGYYTSPKNKDAKKNGMIHPGFVCFLQWVNGSWQGTIGCYAGAISNIPKRSGPSTHRQ